MVMDISLLCILYADNFPMAAFVGAYTLEFARLS